MHGGKTPKAQARAAVVGVEREARRVLADLDLAPVTNPIEALAYHAAEVMALRDYLRGEVSRLESLRYEGGTGEQVRAELSAYQAALRDTTAVLTAIAKLNIDARLVAISEYQGRVVAEVLQAGLAAAGIKPGSEQDRAARAAVAAALRAVGPPGDSRRVVHGQVEPAGRGEIA